MDKRILFIVIILAVMSILFAAFILWSPAEECECDIYTMNDCPQGCIVRCISSCPECDDCLDVAGSCICLG